MAAYVATVPADPHTLMVSAMTMPLRWPSKDVDEVVDYSLDWSARLAISNDALLSSSWAVDPNETDGVVIDSAQFSALTTTVWLSGGVDGTKYVFTNHVTTAGGRTLEQSVNLFVLEK